MEQIALTSLLNTSDIKNKRVLLRADLNVPLDNGTITNDYRLQAIKPTLDLLLKKGAKVILLTHLGRPTKPDPLLSTKLLIPWFKADHYRIQYESDLNAAIDESHRDVTTILLLENMRFFSGEQKNDPLFAQQLAQLGDYYVNDAFGLLHRNDTSITLLPELFAPDHRTIGLLIEKELSMLNALLYKPKKPFVLILGGGKVSDKLPLLYALIDSVDTVLLCPAIVFSFLKADDKPVGKSLVDNHMLDACRQFLADAQARNIRVLFPLDYQVAQDTFNGPLSWVAQDAFPTQGVGISIGPKTEILFADEINQAGTIFFNGLMGSTHNKATLQGAEALFKAMAGSPGISIVGGGDSVAAAQILGFTGSLDFLSTGGGVTLAYLAGENLPGLSCFIKKSDKN